MRKVEEKDLDNIHRHMKLRLGRGTVYAGQHFHVTDNDRRSKRIFGTVVEENVNVAIDYDKLIGALIV